MYDKCKVAASRPAPAPVVLDGSRAECEWYASPGDRAWLPVADLPVTERRDYVANSNDSYWLVNASASRSSLSPMLGPTAIPQRLRTRIGLLEIESRIGEGQRGLDLPQVQAMLFSNRNHSGELFADDTVALCSQPSEGELSEQQRTDVDAACTALRGWDRRNDLDSRGAALFREFWLRAKDIASVHAVAFDAADPIHTPRGLNWREPTVRTKLIAALADAAALIRQNGFAADARLGDIQAVTRNERRIEIHGGAWYDGVLNLNLTRDLTPQGYVPYDGASYIQIVSLGRDGPTAFGLLAYGQSTNPLSAYFSDQTELYSRKQLYRLPYTQQQILDDPAHQQKRLVLPKDRHEGGFGRE
jgi:acyl-homoserine-lactone acylase